MHGDAADELPCGWCLRGQHVLLIIAIRSSCHGPVSCCSAWLVSPVSVSRCAILLQATSMAQPALISFGKQNTRQACKPYPLPCAELFRVGEAPGVGVEQPQHHPGIHDGVCHSHRLQPSPRGMHQLQLLLHVPGHLHQHLPVHQALRCLEHAQLAAQMQPPSAALLSSHVQRMRLEATRQAASHEHAS